MTRVILSQPSSQPLGSTTGVGHSHLWKAPCARSKLRPISESPDLSGDLETEGSQDSQVFRHKIWVPDLIILRRLSSLSACLFLGWGFYPVL